MKKVILAFSGGLDTSFCVLHLQQEGYDVVALTVDTGGFSGQDKEDIAARAKLLKVKKHLFIDGKNDLYETLVSYVIKGNVLRGGVYPLSVGPERITIATKLVEIAKTENASYVSHGSTGAGNDQIRFDATIKVLAPQLNILAPIRDLGVKREDELAILKKHGIPVPTVAKAYSVNKGMLGLTVGGKETKGSWECPPEAVYEGITPLADTPNTPDTIVISFKEGLPVAVNGKAMDGVAIMDQLSKLGGKHGVAKGIHIGNTILGIKGRVAFAAPAITILIKAHKELEKLVLTKWQSFWKDILTEAYGNFLHEALYFDPVVKDIEAMIDSSQKHVVGEVKVKLFKGNIIVEGYKSPYSLLNPQIAAYGEENVLWDGRDVTGFAKIYGLQSILAANAEKIGDAS
jgi:argininosuccinate synthase